ncbi:lipoyl synthase [Bryobacter aggregatus]|uniref:lipoyl synthase n=1 Tax=Bryobacter aggregatus TaxID=360054 RepID=UPI0005682489|nr:lipoyl synthase [Bryobacter aggregatus]
MLVQIEKARPRLPEFLRKPQHEYQAVSALKRDLRSLHLHTVCESARCPNIHECFSRGAATFMILGNLCTRGCGFCSVPKADPRKIAFDLDPLEPAHVAAQAAAMGLRYVVLTSVNRDELWDGGSTHWALTVAAVKGALPEAQVEVLTPDFNGDLSAVERVLAAQPDVYNHNMETVSRLYRRVRPQANYEQSLRVLAYAKQAHPEILSKSGLMVGLGETHEEVRELLTHLRQDGKADIATIGQYLQPTRRNRPVARYVEPQEYEEWQKFGHSLGFRAVFAGPFVRSSYMADLVAHEATI